MLPAARPGAAPLPALCYQTGTLASLTDTDRVVWINPGRPGCCETTRRPGKQPGSSGSSDCQTSQIYPLRQVGQAAFRPKPRPARAQACPFPLLVPPFPDSPDRARWKSSAVTASWNPQTPGTGYKRRVISPYDRKRLLEHLFPPRPSNLAIS